MAATVPKCVSAMTSTNDSGSGATDEHHVYVVECSDGTYYTGYTTNVERRVAEHNDGTGAKYIRGRRPVELVHTESFASRSSAMQREYAIKQLRRAEKKILVRGDEGVE